jgi:cation:H+ antiporter
MENIPVWQAGVLLILSFYLLAKGSTWLVDGAVGIAERFNVPKLLIGIVLVGFATTAPEFAVSVLSAIQGKAEMALGNAVGSVIVDDGVALAFVGIFATTPVLVSGRVLRSAVIFLILVDILCFAFVAIPETVVRSDGTTEAVHMLSRVEGGVLLALFFAYLAYVVWDRVRRPEDDLDDEPEPDLEDAEREVAGKGLSALAGLFGLGLVVIIGASEVVVVSAVRLAAASGIPDAVVALTIIAIGTSLPEIATCITATRRGHGALAVGDIIGADILNIAWIAGASATVNPLQISAAETFFMFPSMLIIVFTMVGGLLIYKRMTRGLGIVLATEYAIYMIVLVYLAFVVKAFPIAAAH